MLHTQNLHERDSISLFQSKDKILIIQISNLTIIGILSSKPKILSLNYVLNGKMIMLFLLEDFILENDSIDDKSLNV